MGGKRGRCDRVSLYKSLASYSSPLSQMPHALGRPSAFSANAAPARALRFRKRLASIFETESKSVEVVGITATACMPLKLMLSPIGSLETYVWNQCAPLGASAKGREGHRWGVCG